MLLFALSLALALAGARGDLANCDTDYASPTCYRRYSEAQGYYYDCHSSDTDALSWTAGSDGSTRYGHVAESLRADGVEKLVVVGGVYETGVGLLVALDTADEYDPVTDTWRALTVNGTGAGVPSARYHAASWEWAGRLFMQGGYNGTHTADAWRLDLVNATAGEWRKVRTTGLAAGRSGHSISTFSTDQANASLVVAFGGLLDDATPCSQLYVGRLTDLDPVVVVSGNSSTTLEPESTIEWVAPTVAGELPPARAYHSAVAISSSCLLVYGGYNATSDTILGDLWELCASDDPPLETSTWTWTEKAPGGTVPTTRYGHAALSGSPGRMLIMGGSSLFPDQFMSSVDEYDWNVDRWLGTTSTDELDGRRFHSMTLVGNSIVVASGVDKYDTLASTASTTYASPMCDLGNSTDYCEASSSLICVACSVGYAASVDDAMCVACAPGTYADAEGLGACVECGAGTYNTNTGSTTADDCTACGSGTYSTATGASSIDTCVDCPAGYISEASSGSTACDICSAGKYSSAGSDSCDTCLQGEYSTEGSGSCSDCLAGTYGPYTGMGECYACSSGQWSYNGSISCEYCGVGTYSDSPRGESPDVCIDCPVGRYGDLEGLSSCTQCPAGTAVNATGSSTLSDCEDCGFGEFSAAGSDVCDLCEVGTYGNRTAATYCYPCPINTYLATTGSTDSSDCRDCPSGSFTESTGTGSSSDCISCQAGSFTLTDALGGQCWPCPAGTYTASDEAAAANNCTMCPPMTTSTLVEGSSSCTDCSGSTFSNEGWGSCTPCDNTTCTVGPNGEACSGTGSCYYGLCECDDGFSGYDCSTGTCDTCYGVLYLDTASLVVSGIEGDTFEVEVLRGVGTEGAVTATLSVLDGNATVGADYSASFPILVSFADGVSTQTVTVPVLDDSTTDEDCEWLQLGLGSATGGAAIGANVVSDVYIDESKFTSRLLSSSTTSTQTTPTEANVLLGTESGLDLQLFVTRPTANDEAPLDLVLLNDISGTFNDDIVTVRTLVPNLLASVQERYSDPYFGVTTFCDKPLNPFGSEVSGDESYVTLLGLTPNTVEVQDVFDAIVTTSGRDLPESQLEALFHAAIRTDEVGWRTEARHVIVLTTDADYHLAGDAADEGLSLPDNNLDDVLDGDPAGSGEDYPSEQDVKTMLQAKNIVPIFCVTSDYLATYETFVSFLGFGRATELSTDSSNLVDIIVAALAELDEEVTVITSVDDEAYVDSITPTTWSNVDVGQTVNFTVALRAADASDVDATVEVLVVGYDFVDINVVREIGSCHATEATDAVLDDTVWLGWLADVDQGTYFAEYELGHPGVFEFQVNGDYVTSSVTGPFGQTITALSGTGGTIVQTVEIDHSNKMPLIVRGFSQSVGASVTDPHDYALKLTVSYQNGLRNETVAASPYGTGDDGWEMVWIKFDPPYAVANATVTAEYSGSAATSIDWYGLGLFSSLDEACGCESGYYYNSRGTCTRCDAGSSCGASALVGCEGNTYSFGGQSSCSECIPGWLCEGGLTAPCGDLTYESDGSCLDCEAGNMCVDGVMSECPAGKWAPASADYCLPCDPGTYSDTAGSSTCLDCDAGQTSNFMRDGCMDCPAGEYSGVGQFPCVSCDPGFYAPTPGSSDCEPCPEGSYAPGHAAWFCYDCPEGTTSVLGAASETECA